MRENAIEWVTGEKTMTVTFSQQREITRVRKLKEKYPDEVEIVAEPETNGGYIVAHMPVSYHSLANRKKSLTDEQKQAASERLAKAREQKAGGENE